MIISKKYYLAESLIKSLRNSLKVFVIALFRPVIHYYHKRKSKIEKMDWWRPYLTYTTEEKIQCNSCQICAQACPSKCITVQEGKDENRPVKFEINVYQCLYCHLCEDLCPIDALRWDWTSQRQNGPSLHLKQLMEDSGHCVQKTTQQDRRPS